jgi:hypothetical protein
MILLARSGLKTSKSFLKFFEKDCISHKLKFYSVWCITPKQNCCKKTNNKKVSTNAVKKSSKGTTYWTIKVYDAMHHKEKKFGSAKDKEGWIEGLRKKKWRNQKDKKLWCNVLNEKKLCVIHHIK